MTENLAGTELPDQKLNYEETVKNENAEVATSSSREPETKMSKRQLKKLEKLAQWEVKKKEKRLKERAKHKQRVAERENGQRPQGVTRNELKRNKADASSNFLKVIVDLDYDDLMMDKALSKCVKQLLRIYTVNRRSNHPAKLHFAGIKQNGRIHQGIEKNDGYQNWDVHWHFEPFSNIFDNTKIVFLTSDSDNVLGGLEEDSYYVIGGLVDYNHNKGLCLDRAEKLGLRTARLPLTEFVDLKTRTVLSTFHVFEILLDVSTGKPWQQAILDRLPMRKGAKAKTIKYGTAKEGQKELKKENSENDKTDENTVENRVESSESEETAPKGDSNEP